LSIFPRVGDNFASRYQLLQALGAGGGGTVFKALQTDCNRLIALKILHPDLLENDEYKVRFLREAKALSKISHPNVVTVYHCGFGDNDLPFVAMEFVDGVDVRKLLIEHRKLPVLRALNIIRQVADALAQVHKIGIVHRDLKPENIVLVEQPEPDTVKLVDFGMARVNDEKTITDPGAWLGTFNYFSPEQAAGKTADQKSDIYSLCVCLYEMVTGELPFVADSPVGVLSKHIYAPVRALVAGQVDRFHLDLNRLIARGMAKDPTERFADMSELGQAACELIYTIRSVAPLPQGKWQRLILLFSSPKARAVAIAIMSVILLLAGAQLCVSYFHALRRQAAANAPAGVRTPVRKRIGCLQTTGIETKALLLDEKRAINFLDEYLNSDRLDASGRVVLLADKAAISSRSSADEALNCAQQSFKLAQHEHELYHKPYQDDLTCHIYLASGSFYLEKLLAAGKYRDALALADQLLPVTTTLSDYRPPKFTGVLKTVTAGDLRILAAAAAVGMNDLKEASRRVDILNSFSPGHERAFQRATILLKLNRGKDLRQFVDSLFKEATRFHDNLDEEIYSNGMERYHTFQTIMEVAQACQNVSRYDLERECFKKAERVQAALEAGAISDETPASAENHVRSVRAYMILSLSKINLDLLTGNKVGARKQALETYQKWLKTNERDAGRTNDNLSYLSSVGLVLALLDSGASQEADQVLKIITPLNLRYCGMEELASGNREILIARLNRYKEDKAVRIFLERFSLPSQPNP
jgi:hypothetical protein